MGEVFWREVMTEEELGDLALLLHVGRQGLEAAVWEQDERGGQEGYVTWLGEMEVWVWHGCC